MTTTTRSPTPSTPTSAEASTPAPKRRPPSRKGVKGTGPPPRRFQPTPPPTYLDVADAAAALGVTPGGLRARLQRHTVAAPDGAVRAVLGPGVTAIKLGGTWRIRIDADAAK